MTPISDGVEDSRQPWAYFSSKNGCETPFLSLEAER